jgi:anti-sigma28 factor (negative regulator of flagellin synthesis)
MRIDDPIRTPLAQATEQSEQAVPAAAGVNEDEVAHFAQSIEVSDPDRIEQLRQQVQSGSYDVSAQVVAEAVIDAHQRDAHLEE